MHSPSSQVNINACLSGVAAGTTAAAATAELDAADITSSVVAAAAEQKWKSSNVKAVVANGKSIGKMLSPHYLQRSHRGQWEAGQF